MYHDATGPLGSHGRLDRVDATAQTNDHARRLLVRQHLSVREVIRVDVDSILYVNRGGAPRTAWVHLNGAGIVIHDVPGFAAEEPAVSA